jgi:MFS transporter, putative metabolite:H+ symporter
MTRVTDRGSHRPEAHTGITFHSARAFWVGTFAIITGVLLHLPEFLSTSDMGYHMHDMAVSGGMLLGMILIIGGVLLAAYGLFPRKKAPAEERLKDLSGYHFRSMDDAELTPAHWGLLFVLGVALIVDVMKPATLGFVVPGLRDEYGISLGQAALLPLVALTGTTVGSFLWGMLSDRLGRRAAILLASLMFIGTSICGFMPSFGWNLVMCFLMGTSAGGMLPIVYALMAESVPAKRRGWLVVLHGGMGTVGGYLAASGLAALLVPHFGWRIMWFLGLPTGALVLLLNRWIPESPRFLLERGRVQDAEKVMARYGVVLEKNDTPHNGISNPRARPAAPRRSRSLYAGFGRLFRPPYISHTLTVGLYGLGWGLVNWGFLTFLPTILEEQGIESSAATALLFWSALIAVPGTVLVAYLYGLWSSKKSMVLYAAMTSATLVGFAFLGPSQALSNQMVLGGLVVLLLVSSGGVISMLSPYTAEVYPTDLRGTGSGLAAGSSKLGGILGPPVAAGVLAIAPGFAAPALVMAAPMALAALVLGVKGIETRGRRLEDITSGSVPAVDLHSRDPVTEGSAT